MNRYAHVPILADVIKKYELTDAEAAAIQSYTVIGPGCEQPGYNQVKANQVTTWLIKLDFFTTRLQPGWFKN